MILEEIISFLSDNLEEGPEVQEIVINPNFTGVLLNDDKLGVAMNIRKGSQFSNELFKNLKFNLIGHNGLEVVNYLHNFKDEKNFILNSIKIGLLNALSQPLMTKDYLEGKGYEVKVGEMSGFNDLIGKEDTVGIIGFSGQCRNIAKKAKKVFVTELYPEMFQSTIINKDGIIKAPTNMDVIPASEAGPYLKKADKVLLTGCTLVTDTMEDVLKQCNNPEVIVYGHSAAFYPEPLFKKGVSVISMSKVKDTPLMMDILKNCSVMAERFFPSACESMIIKKSL